MANVQYVRKDTVNELLKVWKVNPDNHLANVLRSKYTGGRYAQINSV